MKNNEWQKLWKNTDREIQLKTTKELDLLLTSKTKQTINKYLLIILISILSSLGLILFLIITSLHRLNDPIYLTNNILLGILTLIALVSGMSSWYKLKNNKFNLPLKNWLELRITILSNWLSGKQSKLYMIIIPVLYLLTVLSIHVYFEHKPFLDVLKTGESVVGLIVSLPIGLSVAYFVIRKIRKIQLSNLEFLKDLYRRLCSLN